MTVEEVGGSFRDPAGYVFRRDGIYYRRINHSGRSSYELLHSSGLYDALTAEGLLISHDNLGLLNGGGIEAWTVIRPAQVPFVSYPHEWCFSQLKDAANTTLAAQGKALAAGMSLKDANASNIQFVDGRPLLIDTLSFERNAPGPWVAYRQFCQHFYAPLALQAFTDERFARLSRVFLDGLPLRLASRALPASTWLRPGPLFHVHLHAWGEVALPRAMSGAPHAAGRAGGDGEQGRRKDLKAAVLASLTAATRRLRWRPTGTWVRYYDDRESYTTEAIDEKTAAVAEWLDAAQPATVWDLGANTGRFSRLASGRGIRTVAFDQDAACVERMYTDARSRGDRHLLPLVMDLANPSPAIGWAHEERLSLVQRGPADLVLALALVHHLAIGNNVPLERLARFLRSIGRRLVIEFVPKDDPMVVAMLASRADVFAQYSQLAFEATFAPYFAVVRQIGLRSSGRVLYWMDGR